MNFDYDHLRALSAIQRYGSFDAAAFELNVTPSAISQRLKALEEMVGERLIVRAAPCVGTALGQRLARHAEDVALMERDVLPQNGAPARVSIAVNADSLATWFMPSLQGQHDLLFDLISDDQDHSIKLLKEGRVAAAITTRAQPVQGCDSFALGAMRYVATASPSFANCWFSDGVTAQSLLHAPALVFDHKDDLETEWSLREVGTPLQLQSHFVPSTTAFIHAAIAGIGWGLNPEILVRDHLRTGTLVPLGTNPFLDTPLHWQISRRTGGPLKTLTRAIQTGAKTALVPPLAP